MGKLSDIRADVEAELSFDPLVEESGIRVQHAGGEVALNGTVPSYPQYLEAVAAARRVAGVKHVHNHLAVLLPAGNQRDDVQLTTAANNALTWDSTVPEGTEAVAVDGNLAVSGVVSYGAERAAALRAVAGLAGVRRVKDEIVIRGDADPVDVTALVQDALDRNALFTDDSAVAVDTAGHIVTLSGHVRTWAEHDAAAGAAWMASGVCEVVDNVLVTG
jgi:osmotically-inducible protein OsmY